MGSTFVSSCGARESVGVGVARGFRTTLIDIRFCPDVRVAFAGTGIKAANASCPLATWFSATMK